jgi:hypothetical protein
MKRLKLSLMEQHMKRKCKLKNHKISKVEQLRRWRYRQKNHKGHQRKGLRRERTTKNSGRKIGGDYSSNRRGI